MKKFILVSTILFSPLVTFAGTAVTILDATYEVPTSQSALKHSSLFRIQKSGLIQETDGKTTVKYLIPEELTGIKNSVEFTGIMNANGGTLTSEQGALNCLANSSQMMCSTTYGELKFDGELAKTIMASKFEGQELRNRLQLQSKFSTDPIGIMRFYLKAD